jgi:long-chain acyl-CoA synthetase
MMFLWEKWKDSKKPFLLGAGGVITYGHLYVCIGEARRELGARGAAPHPVVLEAENAFSCYVKFLALLLGGWPVFPCSKQSFHDLRFRDLLREETRSEFSFCAAGQSLGEINLSAQEAFLHPLVRDAIERGLHTFLVRTSGSTGPKSKFLLHDAGLFAEKYHRAGAHFSRTIAVKPLAGIGGIETLLEVVHHERAIVAAGDNLSPADVLGLMREFAVDYLHTTPTFLTLLSFGRENPGRDLGGLRRLAYGAEPAPKNLLRRIRKENPGLELVQTYGMSEIGVLRTAPDSQDPSRVRLREDLNPGRIREGILEVLTLTPMLGYLNSPTPTPTLREGWFRTGDVAVEEGGSLRVLGRSDDLINVGGQKFYPSELENLILEVGGVADVTVIREPNDFLGNSVIAEIVLAPSETEAGFLARFRSFSEQKIPRYMGPHKLQFSEAPLSGRFKKLRRK